MCVRVCVCICEHVHARQKGEMEEGDCSGWRVAGGWLPAESQRPNENIATTSESEERDCLRDDNSIREKADN